MTMPACCYMAYAENGCQLINVPLIQPNYHQMCCCASRAAVTVISPGLLGSAGALRTAAAAALVLPLDKLVAIVRLAKGAARRCVSSAS